MLLTAFKESLPVIELVCWTGTESGPYQPYFSSEVSIYDFTTRYHWYWHLVKDIS